MKWLNRQKKRVQTIFAGWTPHFRHLQVQPCDFIAAVNSESSPEVGGGRGWWKPWGWDSGIHKDPKTIRIWGLIKHHHPSIRVKMILLPKSCAQRSTTKWLMWNFWWNRSKTLCLFAATFGQKRLSRNKLYRFFWEFFFGDFIWTSRNGAWYRESFLALRNSSLSCAFPNFNLRRIFWIWPDVLFQQFSQWQQCKRVEHLFLPCLLRPWFRSYSSARWCGCASYVSLLSSRYVLGWWIHRGGWDIWLKRLRSLPGESYHIFRYIMRYWYNYLCWLILMFAL